MQAGSLQRKLGLIIGVNHYQDSIFQPLRFAENDAKALAQWFVNTKGGKWNPPDIQLVQGQHATRELVESLLAQLCLQVAETGDEVLFYFAGHAFVDERSGDGYLALANTRYQDTSTAISIRTLVQSIQAQSRAGHILCIFDCFQTGPAWNMRRTTQYDSKPLLGTDVLTTLQQLPNRSYMCSCRGNDAVSETGENTLGTFAHRLLLGLCGPAAESATGNVTLTKLHAYLFKNLSEQHRPQLFGQQTTPFILVGNPVPAMVAAVSASTPPRTPPSSPAPTGLFSQNGMKTPGSSTTGSGLLRSHTFAQSASSMQAPTPAFPIDGTTASIALAPEAGPGEQQQAQCKQLVAQAQQYMQSQNYKEAFDLIEQALQIVPDDTAALTLKGQLLGTAGRFAEATTVVEQILQQNPGDALAWSMRAVLLSNMGQHQAALSAIERSLEIDANNPESYAIKTRIMESIATEQSNSGERIAARGAEKLQAESAFKDNPRAFFIGAGLQILGLILGTAGSASAYFLHQNPPYASIALVCAGLAIMVVVATRGAFRYGFARLIPTILFSIIAAAILGGAYKVLGLTRIIANIQAQTQISAQAATLRLYAFVLIGVWLAAAALLPLIGCILGLITRLIMLATRRRR
jgi:tetratricopeptide (TPR) repeat protein